MSDEFRQHIQAIHQQIAALQQTLIQVSPQQQQLVNQAVRKIAANLGNLHLLYEETQTRWEAASLVEEELLQKNQQLLAESQYYYDLFQSSPDAHLVTDSNGLILEANQAIAKLLNVSCGQIISKPLAVFVPLSERRAFRTKLNQLSQASDLQNWRISLCPPDGEPFVAQLNIAIIRDDSGFVETLRIGVHNISQYGQTVTQPVSLLNQEQLQAQITVPEPSPPALDGLQVLIVDDEADAREFISAVLESHGIRVMAVSSAAAALAALEQFRPDVLVSDIRMPDENGYSLIRRIRELEAEKGWHIPAAALTAYLAEDQEKALAAGFESHLHKLAQPTELVEMVARLAGRV